MAAVVLAAGCSGGEPAAGKDGSTTQDFPTELDGPSAVDMDTNIDLDSSVDGGRPCAGEAPAEPISGSALQALLDAARDGQTQQDGAGRYIAKPACGTYLVTKPLIIYGNTHLDATGVRIIGRFPTTGVKHTMLLNSVGSSTGGYAAPGNIAVTGGEWDPTWDFFNRGIGDAAPPMNVITLIHTHDVLIENVTILNTKWWHAIEINAVKHATVQYNHVYGWIADPSQGLWHGEAIQLDLPAGSNTWGGLSDLTPCQDIHIRLNTCDESSSQGGWGQLTGSHTSDPDHPHWGIWIEGNTARNTRWDGIGTLNAEQLHISSNTVEDCEGGIYVKGVTGSPLEAVEIIDNHVVNPKTRPGISVRAASGAPISDVVVKNNTVTPCFIEYYGVVTFRPGETVDSCN